MHLSKGPVRGVVGSVVAMAVAAGAFGAITASASAATETKEMTVPGEVVIQNKNRPGDPGNCSAITFVQWADVPGTVSGTAYYMYNGQERSKPFTPPYDDVFTWVAEYQVQPGYHWTQIGKSWADGPRPNDCSDTAARIRAVYTTMVARVVLNVAVAPSESTACKAATAATAAANRKVSATSRSLRAASSARAKKRLRAKLSAARNARRSALTDQRAACSPPA